MHKWIFHIDASRCGGGAAGNTMFICNQCMTVITMLEKCALEEVAAQVKSLKIQESHTKTGMCANIMSAGILVVAFLTFLFGDETLNSIAQLFVK